MNKIGFTLGHEGGHLPDWIWQTPSGASGVKINNTQTGVQYGVTTLDKILASVLSGLAIVKNQPYVPTTQQPQSQYQQGAYPPEYYALLAQQQQNSNLGQAGSDLENFIKNNTGLLLVGGVAVVLFMSGRK